MSHPSTRTLYPIAIALTLGGVARANNNYPCWQGASILNNNWSTSGNWQTFNVSNNDVDNNGDDHVRIGGDPGRARATLDQGYSIDDLTFTTTDGSFVPPTATRTSFLVDGNGWLGVVTGVENESAYANTITAPIQFNGSGQIANTDANAGALSVDRLYLHGNAVFLRPGAAGITVTGEVSGGEVGTSLNVDGPGTVKLNTNNSWAGGLVINSGTVEYVSGPGLGSLGNVVQIGDGQGGTLRRTTTGTTIANLRLGGGEARLDVRANETTTYSGTVTDGFNANGPDLAKTGDGTVVFTGSVDHSGATRVRAGAMRLAGTAFLPNGPLHVDPGATLAYANGKHDTVGQLYGAGTIALNADNRLQIGFGNATTGAGLWSGNITGVGARFTKGGTGLLELASPNAYTGLTLVERGTLLVTNASGSATGTGAVTVASGATLRGTGVVAGTVTVAGGGTLAVSSVDDGDVGIGTLTVGGLTMRNDGVVRLKLKSIGAAAVSDRLDVRGDAALAGTLRILCRSGFDPDAPGATVPRECIHIEGTRTGTFTAIDNRRFSATKWLATSYGPHSVYLSIARPGDATLDASVNFADLVLLAQNYGQASGRTWVTGDFDGNGAVAFADLVALAQNYDGGAGTTPGGALSSDFASDWALARSLVPEPKTLAALAGLAPLATRRRRGA